MSRRKIKQRRFTIQLYDRPVQVAASTTQAQRMGAVPSEVREALRGHDLRCPHCNCEPDCRRYNAEHHNQPVFGSSGRVLGSIYGGPPTITIEAHCHECKSDMEFELLPDGEPHCKSIQIRSI